MICLDAWAVIAWLQGTPGAADTVDRALRGGEAVMSWINLGEVSYIVRRGQGEERTASLVAALRLRCTMDAVTPERVLAAAGIRSSMRMSYADAFAVATARAYGVRLATGDPEILSALPAGEVLALPES